MAGSRAPGPPPAASPGTPAGSWIRSEAPGTPTTMQVVTLAAAPRHSPTISDFKEEYHLEFPLLFLSISTDVQLDLSEPAQLHLAFSA